MPATADPAESSRQALAAALLDYSQAPGRYQVRLRQPQVLFAATREILQIAVGREGEAVIGGAGQAALLRDAARFFVRVAMLFPGADHYALLAVDRAVETPELKDRYRLMMRLLHPDFSDADSGQWPADAAVRVNRAYDVLSSPVQRREYDERIGLEQGPGPSQMPERRPPVAVRAVDDDSRRSRFKTLATVFALAGVALVIVSMFSTGSSDSVQLVQRSPAPVESARFATQEPAVQPQARVTAPAARRISQAAEAPATVRPGPAASEKPAQAVVAAASPSVRTPAVSVPPAPARSFASPVPDSPALSSSVGPSVQSPVAEARREVAPSAPVNAAQAASLPAAVIASAPGVQPVSLARLPARTGPTLTEAQPLLAQLLQLMESGRGDRILNLLDAEARSKPSAQALSRQYDILVDGARPVRLSHVEFKAEPGDGRLYVVGQFRLLAGEQTIGSMGRKMVLRAEFVSRDGNVVITGLSGGPVN